MNAADEIVGDSSLTEFFELTFFRKLISKAESACVFFAQHFDHAVHRVWDIESF